MGWNSQVFISKLNQRRSYASSTQSNDRQPSPSTLHPWFITGFTEASTKSIVVFGTNLTSTVGIKFSLTQLAMVRLAPYQYNVIIGLLLSDGWLTIASKSSKNARLGFSQSADHASYVWFVFNILSHYCSSSPALTTGIRAGNRFYGLQFFTRSMPCITELHSLFYVNGVKLVPQNIYELLTPVALAHMVMGDGSEKSHGLIFCTNSYSVQDVIRLMNVLIIRYRLDCNLRLKTRQNKKKLNTRFMLDNVLCLYSLILFLLMCTHLWYIN